MRGGYEAVGDVQTIKTNDVMTVIAARFCRQLGISMMAVTLSLYLKTKGFDIAEISAMLMLGLAGCTVLMFFIPFLQV